jgi:hypothetical protein
MFSVFYRYKCIFGATQSPAAFIHESESGSSTWSSEACNTANEKHDDFNSVFLMTSSEK